MDAFLQSISIAFLMGMSSVLGISPVPLGTEGDWRVTKEWKAEGSAHQFEAQSSEVVAACQKDPGHYLKFPIVIHAAHELFLDGRLIHSFGDPKFQKTRSFFGAPVVHCSSLQGGQTLTWKAYSYTQYFARINFFPQVVASQPWTNFLNETVSAVSAGALLLISLFSFIISFGKLPNRLVIALCGSYAALSGYFFFGVPEFFGIEIPMLLAHKLADTCVWIGLTFLMYSLVQLEIISKTLFKVFLACVAPAMTIVLIGQSGDQVQLGTSLPFGMTLACLMVGLLRQSRLLIESGSRTYALGSLGLAFWNFSVVNDILVVTGLYAGNSTLSIGTVGGLFFFALSLHEKILSTYRERDYLRQNLEKEVELKTEQLRNKTLALEKAMEELKTTQAELVQSAKLASLGTLAAGIAHEINNSLNFVNGSLRPLERMVAQGDVKKDDPKFLKLLEIMKDGLKLTFGIIQSLKTYTGLNQSALNDVPIQDVVESVLTILRSKLRKEIEVKVSIEPGLRVLGSVVGLNQVFMNLISNSVDAMPQGGVLTITGKSSGKHVMVEVSDSGIGMDSATIERIFEPFFTKKEVGKGTGLGLHIVKKEVERHKGTINVRSEPNRGTTFQLKLLAEAITGEGAVA
jgi:signal transduction histidine kinase